MNYHTIDKHLFEAHLEYEQSRTLIIIAENIKIAKEKVKAKFGLNSVIVNQVESTEDPQIYTI